MKNNLIKVNKIAVAFLVSMLSISLISCVGGGGGDSTTQTTTSSDNPDPKAQGNVSYTIIQPNDITPTNNSITVSLNNSNNQSVNKENVVFGRLSNFKNVIAGNYSLTTASGLADAKSGIYYTSINQPVSVVAGKTTNLGNINFSKVGSGIVPITLNVTGLDNGDTATVIASDSGKYIFNTFTITSGNNTLKFINGDNVTLTLIVGLKYQSLAPINFVASSGNLVNATVTKAVNSNSAFVYSAYKDVDVDLNWKIDLISTMVNESVLTPLAQALPNNANTATWAFAYGECGNELWRATRWQDFASVNVDSFVKANKNYIVSTGGEKRIFTCSTQNGMKEFVEHYMSANLVGFDFDIESSQTNSQISALINNIAYIKTVYPNLRISFTLATLADSTGSHAGLNATGDYVVKTAQNAKLDFYINLKTMNYADKASPSVCVINPSNNRCDMAKSAIQAVQNLQYTYKIAANRIEVTPLIGDSKVFLGVFNLSDATTLAAYVKDNGLAGYHYWSYDRDTPCTATNSRPSKCNWAPNATPLGFNNAVAPYFQ